MSTSQHCATAGAQTVSEGKSHKRPSANSKPVGREYSEGGVCCYRILFAPLLCANSISQIPLSTYQGEIHPPADAAEYGETERTIVSIEVGD